MGHGRGAPEPVASRWSLVDADAVDGVPAVRRALTGARTGSPVDSVDVGRVRRPGGSQPQRGAGDADRRGSPQLLDDHGGPLCPVVTTNGCSSWFAWTSLASTRVVP